MKSFCLLTINVFLGLLSATVYAQIKTNKQLTIVAGIAGPELIHSGINYRITSNNSLGINAGIGPTNGGIWPSINLEHRLYFGKNDSHTSQKVWFCRQGITVYPSAETTDKVAFTLTAGKDLSFKKAGNGITIDAGVFYLGGSERSSIILIRSLNLWPALRFQLYFGL